ncbi:zeta toxin family protein [Pedobacter rhizosphaerae]|uniref:Predicted ABC-type ATPase n=1 Tax=Pedobacter rhizosphaerae TaxID=390241 RepID=A0A1H9VUM2_9SPHI|nr:zeta toxin family protein [Pedobacter rhizosphaerae]SES25466.1 Predicted ABC-type ATPase [Pedobacter rhizosphaerae]
MDYNKPTLLVISDPNGAGKSTHIQTMLPLAFDGIVSFDRDSTRVGFESELQAQGISDGELVARATRMMEDKLKELMVEAINSNSHFVLETPLSHPDYWRYIDMFDNAGYQLQLNYLCLDKVSDCMGRVEQRVLEGGHYVRPDTIKGVYNNNLIHINTEYQTFYRVELYDGMIVPTLLCSMEKENVRYLSPKALKKKLDQKGYAFTCN